VGKTPTAPQTSSGRTIVNSPAHDRSHAAVAEFLKRITEDLSQGPLNLPCFPDIVPRIRQALADPNSKPEDIVRIAGTEPRLAARLLQTANSAVFNPGGQPLTNLRHAITRLGHSLVQSATMAFAVQQMKTESTLRPVAKPLNDLWERSVAVASICQVLAQRLHVPGDKVFLTGLLHGIGHFYILVRAAGAPIPMPLDQLLSDEVARCHPAIGRIVLKKWGFESIVCDAVGSQNEHERHSKRAADITDVLIASVALGRALLEHNGDLTPCAGIHAFASLGLKPDDLTAILKHTEHTLDALRDSLGC
jgi:HD-like signal output (HDOD) protein